MGVTETVAANVRYWVVRRNHNIVDLASTLGFSEVSTRARLRGKVTMVPILALGLLGVSATFMFIRAARMSWLLRLYLSMDEADSLPKLEVRQDIAER